jgi:hypothetical protein
MQEDGFFWSIDEEIGIPQGNVLFRGVNEWW